MLHLAPDTAHALIPTLAPLAIGAAALGKVLSLESVRARVRRHLYGPDLPAEQVTGAAPASTPAATTGEPRTTAAPEPDDSFDYGIFTTPAHPRPE